MPDHEGEALGIGNDEPAAPHMRKILVAQETQRPGDMHPRQSHGIGDVDAALAGAPIKVNVRIRAPRCHPMSMETRGTVAAPDPITRGLTYWTSTQAPHGHRNEIAPGEAWFEAGPAPVLAWAPDDRVGYFSRVMILPRSLLGKSSLSYVNAEDADKPKLQRYTIFVDRFITI